MTHFIIPTKEYLKMQKKFLPHAVFKNIIHPTFHFRLKKPSSPKRDKKFGGEKRFLFAFTLIHSSFYFPAITFYP
jgi:hypothetical protein